MGFIYFSSQLSCPPRFENFPQTRQREGFLVFGNSLCYSSLPGRVSVPRSFVSLFIFCILSRLLSKTMGCFSGRLVSAASDQKLFLQFAQRSDVLSMNLWGRKWSPRPVPPPS